LLMISKISSNTKPCTEVAGAVWNNHKLEAYATVRAGGPAGHSPRGDRRAYVLV